jgi:hypothetical protein
MINPCLIKVAIDRDHRSAWNVERCLAEKYGTGSFAKATAFNPDMLVMTGAAADFRHAPKTAYE